MLSDTQGRSRPLSAGSDRVNVITQLVSQVSPPSSENVCSNRAEIGVMSTKLFRTRITLSSNDS
jgi:hypothetical protein